MIALFFLGVQLLGKLDDCCFAEGKSVQVVNCPQSLQGLDLFFISQMVEAIHLAN